MNVASDQHRLDRFGFEYLPLDLFSLALSQAHSGPIAILIDEFDAGAFKRTAHS
jgi:hypothetical protein